MATFAHFVEMAHLDRHSLAGFHAAVVLGLIGAGLAACMVGAVIYDVGRWFSAW